MRKPSSSAAQPKIGWIGELFPRLILSVVDSCNSLQRRQTALATALPIGLGDVSLHSVGRGGLTIDL